MTASLSYPIWLSFLCGQANRNVTLKRMGNYIFREIFRVNHTDVQKGTTYKTACSAGIGQDDIKHMENWSCFEINTMRGRKVECHAN